MRLLKLFLFFTCIAVKSYSNSMPFIMMGGVWSAESQPNYSNLSRVCHIGMTHVFSYITEPNIGESRTVEVQMRVSKKFASTVKENCPHLKLVMGIPSDWIFHKRFDLINSYIESIHANKIKVDYWLSDEVINEMMKRGIDLDDAVETASQVIKLVEKKSKSKYIWIEPGNYGNRYENILNDISNIPYGIKSYDQYIISKYRRLSDSLDKFNTLNSTLIKLKHKNKVFPVCDISASNTPTQDELNSIVISLLMNKADGFVFWDERWTSDGILLNLKHTIDLANKINRIGVYKFKKINESPLTWQSKYKGSYYRITINTLNENLEVKNSSLSSENLLPTQINFSSFKCIK